MTIRNFLAAIIFAFKKTKLFAGCQRIVLSRIAEALCGQCSGARFPVYSTSVPRSPTFRIRRAAPHRNAPDVTAKGHCANLSPG